MSSISTYNGLTPAGVTAEIAALPYKANVRAATTAALAALTATTQTLTANSTGALAAQDGVTLVLNDTLLVKDQAAPAQNGKFYLSTLGVTAVAQVETATVVATITGSGEMVVTVTGTGITGSPLAVPVSVVNTDDSDAVALAIRTELSGVAAITALYAVSGATNQVILTRSSPTANDATLNIALATGDAVGVTPAPTSANTTAGVAGVAFVLTRSTDADTWDELTGCTISVTEGTVNGDHTFKCTSNAGGTLGTTAVTFVDASTVAPNTATPAGGSTAARLLFGTTAGFGVYYGSGAPTVSAAQGSLYLRSDGSGIANRLYVNTNGTTGWTNFVSAA